MRAYLSLIVLLSLLSCTGYKAPSCDAKLTKKEIMRIVSDEISRHGGDPSSVERSKIKIRRQGCDYVYQQIHRPQRPCGYLFVRLDQFGNVTDWFPGLQDAGMLAQSTSAALLRLAIITACTLAGAVWLVHK